MEDLQLYIPWLSDVSYLLGSFNHFSVVINLQLNVQEVARKRISILIQCGLEPAVADWHSEANCLEVYMQLHNWVKSARESLACILDTCGCN